MYSRNHGQLKHPFKILLFKIQIAVPNWTKQYRAVPSSTKGQSSISSYKKTSYLHCSTAVKREPFISIAVQHLKENHLSLLQCTSCKRTIYLHCRTAVKREPFNSIAVKQLKEDTVVAPKVICKTCEEKLCYAFLINRSSLTW